MLQKHPTLKRALSLVLSLAIILTTCVSLVGTGGKAEAAASLPYIEELKNQQGGAFKILEIAPSAEEGSIGYYIGGAEPCRYFPSQAAADKSCYTVTDGAVTPGNNKEKRVDFVTNKFTGLTKAGIMSKGADKAPLTRLNDYGERYPWDLVKDTTLASTYVNTLTLSTDGTDNGVYYEKVGAETTGGVSGIKFTVKPAELGNSADVTDYAYNAATRYNLNTTNGTYVQDVSYYTADASQITRLENAGDQIFYYAPVFQAVTVTVTPDKNETGNETGTETVSATYTKDGQVVSLPDGTAIYANEADYASKDPASADALAKNNYYYLNGKYYADPSKHSDAVTLDDAHTYYCVTDPGTPTAAVTGTNKYAAVGTGFHTPAATGETANFTPEGGKQAYKYVGAGKGSYKCEKADNDNTQYILYTNTVYYPTCYKNNEWFKRYVFDCDYSSGALTETLKLNLTVETKKPGDVTLDDVNAASLIVLSYGMDLAQNGSSTVKEGSFTSDLNAVVKDRIAELSYRKGTEAVTPLIIDSRLQSIKSSIPNLFALAKTDTFLVSDSTRVKDNVYLYVPDDTSPNFATSGFIAKIPNESLYQAVADTIYAYNVQHSAQGSDKKLSSDVTMAACVRHIINAARATATKGTVRVLEIEPGKAYNGSSDLSTDTIKKAWLHDTNYTVNITTWSTSELIGRIDDLSENFDAVYVGSNISGYYTKQLEDNLNQTVIDCNDDSMDGMVYTNIGDKVHSGGGNGYSLSGLLQRDYCTYGSETYIDASKDTTDQFRFSGNDLTESSMNALSAYADAGHPVILADDLTNTLTARSPSSSGHIKVNGDILSLLEHDFSYSITANKSTLTVNPDSSNWIEDVIKYFNGSKYLTNLKNGINNPVYKWEYSTGNTDESDWHTIPGATTNVLTVTPYTNTKYGFFRCTIDINRFRLNIWKVTGSAVTQVAQLEKFGVNDYRVDNRSYMWKFLDHIAGKSNVFSEGEFSLPYDNDTTFTQTVAAKQKAFTALVNISNPQIDWVKTDSATGYPTEYSIDASGAMTSLPETNGKCSLDYSFKITNPTQANNSTTYSCKLFVDSNGDGRFSDDEALSSVDVYDSEQRLAKSLRASDGSETRTYTISRPLPDELCGIVPWKLEVIQNGNETIHCSRTGFAHIAHTTNRKAKEIKVLQITPTDPTKPIDLTSTKKTTIDLTSPQYTKLFSQISGDYVIKIELKSVSDPILNYAYMNKFDMLILGFGDAYGEMSAATASDIKKFIATDKAVLFSHDCASFFALPKGDYKQYNGKLSQSAVYSDSPLDFMHWFTTYYGYNFNTTLRDVVGLDRYGVSSVSTVANGYASANLDTIKEKGYSIAYQPGSAKDDDLENAKTVPETQGLTNNILMRFYKSGNLPYGYIKKRDGTIWSTIKEWAKQSATENNDLQYTECVTQVNKGQITSYPFNVNTKNFGGSIASDYMEVSETHMQYQQLNMNSDDVVVWYCLAHGGSKNIITDYVLGSPYDYMTNDVANQYYIYTRGNVTYTGSGHNANQTDDERKLLVNTIIAAARQGQTAPTAVFTDQTGGKTNITNVLVPADGKEVVSSTDSTDVNRRIYFKLQDTSLVPSTNKTFSAAFSYQIGSNNAVTLASGTVPMYTATNAPASTANMNVGQLYYVKLDELLGVNDDDIKNNLGSVKFQITPSVKVGSNNAIFGSPVSVTLNKMQLFNLG